MARAELRESAERLAEAWRGVGASVAIDRTRFLVEESDDQRPIVVVLPDLPEGECTTVVLLGARGLGFHVRIAGPGAASAVDEPEMKRIPSAAGAVSIERCGEAPLRRLVVASDSGRGAFETVVARSSKPLPPLRTVLPGAERGDALADARSRVSCRRLPPPERRAEVAEIAGEARRRRHRTARDVRGGRRRRGRRGADARPRLPQPRSSSRSTRAPCAPGGGASSTSTRELRDASDDRLLARDRTDAPDANAGRVRGGVDARVASSSRARRRRSPVLVAHASWPLPEHLPALWGSEAQGRMAHVLLARHVMSLPGEPGRSSRRGATG